MHDSTRVFICAIVTAVLLPIVVLSQTWVQQTSGTTQALRSVVFTDANTGWAVGDSGAILHTVNRGVLWSPQPSGTLRRLNSVAFVSSSLGWVAGDSGLIKRTTDGGSSWTNQTTTANVSLNDVRFINANVGWIVGSGGVALRTTNGGNTWSSQTLGAVDLQGVSFSDALNGWTVGGDQIFSTANGGSIWTLQTTFPPDHVFHDVISTDPNSVWIAGNSGVIITRYPGRFWWGYVASGTTNNLRSLAILSSGTGFAVGDHGTVTHTTTGYSGSWAVQASGTTQTLLATTFVNDSVGWAVGDSGSIFKYTPPTTLTLLAPNGGETWFTQDVDSVVWYPGNLPEDVRIELNRNYPSGNWETITDDSPNSGVFLWLANGTATTSARIRITGVTYTTVGDTSNANFTIADRTLHVQSPNGGETLYTGGDIANITWSSYALPENVRIEIKRTYPSGVWETLAASVPNSGLFAWSVTGPATNNARIRITALVHGIIDESDANFSIRQRSLTLTAPNGGETLLTGDNANILWSSSDLPERVRIQLNRSYPGGSWETLVDSTDNIGSYSWIVSGPLTNLARIRIEGTIHGLVGDTSNANFAISGRAVTMSAPNGGEYWHMQAVDTIRWTSQHITGNVSIKLKRAYPSGNWETLFSNVANDGSEPWVVTGPADAHCRIRIESSDYPAVYDESDEDFAIGGTSVCGNVSGTWNTAGSPYFVGCDLIVQTGQTLTIQPGVRVEFLGHYRLDVNGLLLAQGTQSDSIFFTCDTTVNPLHWIGIRFYDSSDDASLLNYCVVERAISNPTSDWPQYFGAVYCDRSSPTLSHCWIRNNHAFGPGGGFVPRSSQSHVTDCIFSNNRSDESGGGVNVQETGGNVSFDRCSFVGNSATGGGGVEVWYYATASFTNCIFANNVATSGYGGGLGIWSPSASATVDRCTFANNSDGSQSPAGQIIAVNGCTLNLKNSIVASGNHAGVDVESGTNVACAFNDLYDNAGGSFSGAVPAGSGQMTTINARGDSSDAYRNIVLDPRFVNSGSGDYHLSAISPCIDTGDPATPHDADGSVADMGAYYFAHQPPFIAITRPDGGEVFVVGDPDTIRWTSGWLQGKVGIALNRGYPADPWETLADSAVNSGVFPWIASSPVTQTARIRITSLSAPAVGDTSSSAFTIGSRSVTLTSPTVGETWVVNESHTVQWTSAYLSESVKLELKRDYPNGSWEVLTPSTPNNGAWDWVVTGPITPAARIRISGVIHPDISDTTDGNFSIGVHSLTLVAPQGGESWTVGEYRTIVWTSQNLAGGISLELNRTYPTGVWEIIEGSAPNSGSYIWRVTSPVSNQVRVRIRSVSYPAFTDVSDNNFAILPASPGHLPGLVSHPFPSDSSTRIAPTPFLAWFPADSAERYDVYLWPDTASQPLTPIAANVLNTYFQTTASLSFAQHYRWRVVAKNFYGETPGPIWLFAVRSLPDLAVQEIRIPQLVYTEHNYQITWLVHNIGEGNTVEPSWSDAVYISPVPIFGGQAILLGQFDNVSALSQGESYANTASFTVPRGTIPGRYYIFVRTDQNGEVLESNESNNLASAADTMQILLTPPPDLQVTSILVPSHAFSGDDVSLTWTVRNRGAGPTVVSQWSDAIIFSHDSIPSVHDVTLGTFSHSGLLRPESTYTASATVTLPQTIHGAYYFTIRTDTYNQVYEFLSDGNNSTRSDSVSVTLSPPPDLVVSDITIPPNGISGQTVDIGWTVQNQGAGAPFESGWSDRVFLSANGVFDLGSCMVLGTFSRSGTLAPNGTYLRQETVTLPVGLGGPYFVFVMADCDSQVFEFLSDSNNVSRSTSSLQVELPPWADLVVDTVTAPVIAGSGDSVAVGWTVTNRGGAATLVNQWQDRVYITASNTFVPDSAISAGTFPRTGALQPGDHYSKLVWAKLPDGISGNYHLFVFTDADSQVYEYQFNGNNNTQANSAITIGLTPWPDLQTMSIAVPDTILSGQRILINWTVRNFGIGSTRHDSWVDRVYLYNHPTLVPDSAYLLAQTVHSGGLIPGIQYVAHDSVTLPDRITGDYYFNVVTDANRQEYEYLYEGNNTTRRDPQVHVQHAPWADLIVSSVVVPAGGVSGEHVTVQWTVRNQGNAPTTESFWADRAYVSTQPTFDTTTAVPQGNPSHSGILAAGGSYSQQMDVVLPNGFSGSCYVFVMADWGNRVYEFVSDTNNIARSLAIPVTLAPWPDLQVSSAQISGTAHAGDSLSVSFAVANLGQVSTDGTSWVDNVYLLAGDVWNPGAALLLRSSLQTGVFANNSSFIVNSRVFLPSDVVGSYRLYVKTDASNNIYEYTDENNNVTHTATFNIEAYPPVDLAVTSITAPDSAWSGQSLNVQWTVQNAGIARTTVTSWRDAVYFSLDTLLNPVTDILVASYNRSGALDPGQSYPRQQTIALANGTAGDYFLLIKTDMDGQVNDANSGNNTRVRTPVMHLVLTPPPDLRVSSMNSPLDVNAGQPLHLSWAVRNMGTGPTVGNGWNDGVFLSLDAQLNVSDTRLATFVHDGALAVGDSYSVNLDVDIPAYVSGNYYLFVKTDTRDDIYEHTGEGNNVTSRPLGIQTPLMADLIVSDITVPDSAAPGDPVTVSWTLSNVGMNAASGWIRDAVYFAPDTVWTVDDPLLGLANRYINIEAGATLRVNKQISPSRTYRLRDDGAHGGSTLDEGDTGELVDEMPGVPLGSYHAVVRTDLRNSLPETNEQNNTGFSSSQIHIVVPSLPLGVPYDVTVGETQMRYYRVDAGEDLDLRVTLIGTLADATNELYEAYNRVPTLSDFDNCGTVPFMSSQQVFVPATRAGSYYLMALARSLPSGHTSESIRLVATALSFSVLSISPNHGGSDGSITCSVQGAGFDSSFHISLVSPDTVVTGLVLSIPNRMQALVNWNLRQIPERTYDVVVARGDDSRDTLHSGFTVEPRSGSLDLALQGPSLMRTNRDYEYGVYANNGANVDFTNARILVQVPAGIEYRLNGMSEYVSSTSDAIVEAMLLQVYPGTFQSLSLSLRSQQPLGLSEITAAIVEPDSRIGFESAYLGHLISAGADTGQTIILPPTDSTGYDSSLLWDWSAEGSGYVEYFRTSDVQGIPAGDAWGMRLDGDSIAIFCGHMTHDYQGAHPGTGRIQVFRMADLVAGPVPLWDGQTMRFEHRFSIRPAPQTDMPALADLMKQNLAHRRNVQISLCNHPDFDPLTQQCSTCGNQSSSSMDNVMWLVYHNSSSSAPNGTVQNVLEHWLHDDRMYLDESMAIMDEYDLGLTETGMETELRRRVREGRALRIRLVASQDPDAVSGPLGFGEGGWIRVEDPCGYTIHFENQAIIATAPAQVVHVTIPLNANLNMNSFRLGSFGFANMTFDVPENRAYFAERLDLRDSLGVYVDVTGGVDVNAHQAFWVFESIDPRTGEPPTDPLTGMLPVNDSLNHRGEGFVGYTIQPRSDAASGAVVDAQARIIFDVNDPLDTRRIYNTLDCGNPVSHMDSTVALLDSATFVVRWTGHDDPNGSGIGSYDLYTSYNGSPFELAQSAITDTQFAFTGDLYNHYAFFTIAHDNVGHTEAMKTEPEAQISLNLGAPARAVDDLTIHAERQPGGFITRLHWSPVTEDTTGRTITIGEYRVYSRLGSSDRNGVWRQIAAVQDTACNYIVPSAEEPSNVRLFQVIAIAQTADRILTIDPGWRSLPVHRLRNHSNATRPAARFAPPSVSKQPMRVSPEVLSKHQSPPGSK